MILNTDISDVFFDLSVNLANINQELITLDISTQLQTINQKISAISTKVDNIVIIRDKIDEIKNKLNQ